MPGFGRSADRDPRSADPKRFHKAAGTTACNEKECGIAICDPALFLRKEGFSLQEKIIAAGCENLPRQI